MVRLLFPFAAVAVLAAGCGGGDDFRKTYPVTGTMTVNGSPAEPGVVVFLHPQFTETDRYPIHPRGVTNEAGAFKITTYNTDDGAPEGEYVATVEWPLTSPMSSYASGDLFGGLFAKLDVNKAQPEFKVNVNKNGAMLALNLTLTPDQMTALATAKKKAKQKTSGFNLTGQ